MFAHLEAEPPAPSAQRPELPAALDAVIAQGAGEGAGAALRELPRVRPGGARGRGRRGEPPARRRRLPCRRRQERPERGRGRVGRQGDRPPARARAGAGSLGPGHPGPRGRRGDLPVQGSRELRAGRCRVLLRPRAARRRARRPPRRRRLPRHRRPVGQRQVVGPPRRSSPGPRRRSAAGQRGLAASAAATRRAAAGRASPRARLGSEGSSRRGARHAARQTRASSSPSTSSRSCSPPAAPRPSAPPSPTPLLAQPPIRRVAQSSWSRCAPTSTGASPPTRDSPSCWGRTTCWSGRCRPRSCGAPSSCPPAGWGCGWSRSWPTRWSTTSRASRARCRCCPPPCSSSGRSGRTTRSPWPPTASPAAFTAPSRGWPRAPTPASPTSASRSCARIMLRLVGEGEGDAPVRRRAPLAELDLERNEDVADVLATLADSRLVTVGEGTVEVAHEALLREWPRLREWIEEDAEGRRLRRHITQAATEWDAAGRDQGELYRGARLAAALDWTADHALDLNELEREFVTESREASEQETKRARRTNRRLRALLAGVAVLLAAAVARRDLRRHPARRGARRRDGPARPAPRRPGARRGGPRPFAPARPPGGRDRRLAADPRLPARRPPARPGRGRDHARRATTASSAGSPSAPTGRRSRSATSATGCSSSTPGRSSRSASRCRSDGLGERSRTARTGDTRSRIGGRRHVPSPGRRATREKQLAEVGRRRSPADPPRVHEGRRRSSRCSSRRRMKAAEPTRITIRDAATLRPIGPPIEPEGFAGAYVGSPSCGRDPSIRADARRPLARHRVRGR